MLGMMEGPMSDLIIATRDRRRVRLGEIGVLVTLGCTLGVQLLRLFRLNYQNNLLSPVTLEVGGKQETPRR